MGDILGVFIAIFKNSVLIQDAEVCGIVAEPVFFAWAERPGLAWLNNFVMAFSMLGGLVSSLAWVRIFG